MEATAGPMALSKSQGTCPVGPAFKAIVLLSRFGLLTPSGDDIITVRRLTAAGFKPRRSPASGPFDSHCLRKSPIHATHPPKGRNLIGGELVESKSKDRIDVINPFYMFDHHLIYNNSFLLTFTTFCK
ncbi:SpoU rRNA Methylase family [Musa troglodytarum]|uniref:SpoU rRNA Methylase family n=1 Tax=Musa troglodytarum TaxID=320322 RepID=A0A9E7FSV7_9LILI|nr:SpoU rRNA Methylase family [Musa troglodytarum]